MSETVQLLEFVRQTGPFEVDVENAVIKGVRVIGLESQNGRTYTRDAVKGALSMYEGVGTNVNHPARAGEPVTVERRNGWLSNVRQESDGGARGDWHLLKADAMTAKILEVAVRRPQLLALSHNASGKTRRENGREIVESIQAVHSVDCVVDGATTKGLHEGTQMKRTMKQLTEALKPKHPKLSAALLEMAEAGLVSGEAEAPAEEGDDAKHFAAGVVAAIGKVLTAAVDSGDWDTALDKINAYVKTLKKHMGKNGNGNGKTEETPAETPAATEGKAGQQGNLNEQLQIKALRKFNAAGIRLTPILERALDGCKTEKDVEELVEEAKKAPAPTGGARSSERGGAGGTGTTGLTEQKVPTDPKDFAKYARS